MTHIVIATSITTGLNNKNTSQKIRCLNTHAYQLAETSRSIFIVEPWTMATVMLQHFLSHLRLWRRSLLSLRRSLLLLSLLLLFLSRLRLRDGLRRRWRFSLSRSETEWRNEKYEHAKKWDTATGSWSKPVGMLRSGFLQLIPTTDFLSSWSAHTDPDHSSFI